MINKASRHIVPVKQPQTKRLNIIIPAGGIPRKLKSKGPKSLVKIHQNMSLLEVQYRNIPTFHDDYDVIEIFVVTGFQHEKIRKNFRGLFDIRFVFNPLFDQTNVCYGIGLALENAHPGDTLIIYGDMLFTKSFIQDINKDKTSKILIDTNHIIKSHKIGVTTEKNIITNMAYSLPIKFGGVVFLTGKENILFEKIVFDHDKSSLWFLHEALLDVMNNSGRFYSFEPDGKFLEIENKKDVKRASGNIK